MRTKYRKRPSKRALVSLAMAECQRHIGYTQMTTDQWSESFAGNFSREVDTHIEMMTKIRGEAAYALRRMIMISLRQFCRDKGLE